MIPPTGWVTNSLLTSVFSVGHNAAKNIIFRISAVLLQYTVFKFLSYIAYRLAAYASFLMFLEDTIQKLYFVSAHGIGEHSWIVIVFLILFPAAGFYDTGLWALDAPGYIIKSNIVNARSFSDQNVPNAAYIINIPGSANEVNLERSISSELYMQNITLINTHLPISQEVVAPLQNLSLENQPRIWLDPQGWSVGLDLSWPAPANFGSSCTPNSTDTQQKWACHLNNTSTNDLFTRSFGEPHIWWDSATLQPDILAPIFKENLWYTLGPNGSSAVMKQILTLTKSQRRNTLLETVWKATMSTPPSVPFQDVEVLELIRRAWNNDPDQIVNPEIKSFADEVMLAQARGDSLSLGLLIQEPFAIRASTVEFLTVLNPTNVSDQQRSSLRIRSSNITLLWSETLSPSDTIQPFAPCPGPFANIATGGRVRDTTCPQHASTSDQPTTNGFKGQIGASTVVIFPDILGKGDTNTSADVFDPQGQSWLLGNQAYLDELMATRSFILTGNSDMTKVAWQEPVAAISYLQLILLLVPIVLAMFAWVLMAGNSTSHYKHSFLAAVFATTHVSDNSCRRIGYLKNPPLVTLKKVRRHVVVGTPNGGTLVNVERDQIVAYSMVTEPLDLPELAPTKGSDK
ncbi:hypothetical protein P691DRAFT_727893 [Macrolepiota fuliginosa MF-IS2]|uniref:Transmembrane protein n=1 Tax=Macrolepiota fuliginosa MF-IS2 TaxID=1400762 RepID=A0A9P5XHU3_9AGAR|nr:hypothetical protein P691DRAFT_727893 [Macrolepiota fuliginosa MF-IS2]